MLSLHLKATYGTDDGNVDSTKLNVFVFGQFQSGYYKIGEKVGDAWKSGRKFIKKTK